jgi:hypothetical protein
LDWTLGEAEGGFVMTTLAGGNKVSPRRTNVSTNDVKGVTNVGTEGGFADAATAEEMVTKGVKGGVTTGAWEVGKFIKEAG